MFLYTIPAFLLYVFINAWLDAGRIIEGEKINHTIEAAKQLTAIILFSLISTNCTVVNFEFLPLIKNIVFFSTLFWLVFDYVLNFLRGLPWEHLGHALTDQILKDKRYWRLFLKIGLVSLAIIFKLLPLN